MSWANTTIAQPMGYARAVLFPRARDAFRHYLALGHTHRLPICICPEMACRVVEGTEAVNFLDVDKTGMARGTQLYGYRTDHNEALDLDPLLTGWWREPTSPHRLISLGRHKILPLFGGGVFCTNDPDVAEALGQHSFFPGGDTYIEKIRMVFEHLPEIVHARWNQLDIWDRHLGDLLDRIPREQAMPWRCMRLAPPSKRGPIIRAMREAGIAVSINYPSFGSSQYYPGGMWWESRVLNFHLGILGDEETAEKTAFRAARIIERTMDADSSRY